MKRIYSLVVLLLLFIVNIPPAALMSGAQLQGWSQDIRLTFTENTSYPSSIAVWNNNVHVVWGEAGEGRDIFLWYINSTDGGVTWNSPVPLVNTPPLRVSSPKIAVYKNNIHVIWLESNEKRLYYIRSLDNGITWSAEKILASMVYYLTSNWDISMYENNLHVVYMGLNHKLSYVKSNDNGLTWTAPKGLISTNILSIRTAIAANGSKVHIVWEDNKYFPSGYGERDIFYIKSEDNGLTWEKEVNITNMPMILNYYVAIDIKNDYIYIVYGQQESVMQVYFSYSEDCGTTWVGNTRLSNSTANIYYPSIAVNEKRIFVVWTDDRDGPSQIYFKNSSDGGKTWSSDTRLTYAFPYSAWPDIVTNETSVHVVWYDLRDGNGEVYYKRYLISGLTLKATIDIDPNTLNLKSKGRWITAYIELEGGYDCNDINISTIRLENAVPAEYYPTEIGDYDSDSISDIMVKFDRSDVEDMLTPSESVTLKITGSLKTDKVFEGSDDIRVIRPP